jgi:hypothetical protein
MKPEIQKLLARTDADLSRMAALMGRKGGKAKSERKTAAARANAKKPRKRKTLISEDGNWKMTYIGKDKP